MNFISAYRTLRPAEKAFVDAYVQRVEYEAQRNNERITLALQRPVPADVVETSRGLLDYPMVRAAIAERITQIAQDTELSVNRVIREISHVAFASMENYMEVGEDGKPSLDLTKCTPEQLSAIASIEINEGLRGRVVKFKLHSKLDALKMLAIYVGAQEPENPHWRAEQANTLNHAALPATISEEAAADTYARMING